MPCWNLHNVDYNSLKHQIKTHTTKDQAAVAIAIPGHQDQHLRRFEDAFYSELRLQHDRVGLFVTSKADEISRRLRMSCSPSTFFTLYLHTCARFKPYDRSLQPADLNGSRPPLVNRSRTKP